MILHSIVTPVNGPHPIQSFDPGMEETLTPERGMQESNSPSSSRRIDTVNPWKSTPAVAFNEKALPLHVNLTHTPPKLHDDDDSELANDPGHIGTLTLVPCVFADGSNGWKGRRKVNVDLLNVQPGEKASMVDVTLFVSAKVANDQVADAPDSQNVAEVDGGAGGYETDNDDSGMKL